MKIEELSEAVKKQVISELLEFSKNVVEEKVNEFRKTIESERNKVIGGILDSIEIIMCENQLENKINIVLKYSPRIEVNK